MDSDSEFSLSAMVYPELKTTHRLDFGVNFHIWRQKIGFVLVDNKVNYVLTDPKPPENDVARHQKWIHDDFIARHLIMGTLNDHVYMCYETHETAKSLMDALTATYTQPSMTKRMYKLRNYVGHKMAEGKSVHEHIMEMGSMAYDLQCEGLKIPEEVQAVMLMNSVPESWDEMMTVVRLNMDFDKSKSSGEPDFGLHKVSSRLREIGALKKLYRRQEEEEAKQRRPHFNGHCHTCGEYGHHRNHCTIAMK
ncbi:uncharacterized protein LOC133734579 [Rosa rugosa]|uniref:uncharacterized protein LOC133734579 n=1 Tax=Rosa rugosa TaxID=74645 RepID=UPI002B40633D|nr:uncharacterized protein LOC133734579 [Rosa rugosa]